MNQFDGQDFLIATQEAVDSSTLPCFEIAFVRLREVARPERFELPAFWFVVEKSGNPKALQVSHLQTHPLQNSCLSWSTSWYTRVPGS